MEGHDGSHNSLSCCNIPFPTRHSEKKIIGKCHGFIHCDDDHGFVIFLIFCSGCRDVLNSYELVKTCQELGIEIENISLR